MKKLITIFFFVAIAVQSHAQWVDLASGVANTLRCPFFIDEDNGWIVGEAVSPDQSIILHTTDGGDTWTSMFSGTTNALRGVHFVDANTGVIVGFTGTILRTTDGGATWSSISSGTTQPLRSVYFSSASIGYACGGVGTMLKTTDGGLTWTSQTTGLTNDLIQVRFVDDNTGYATSSTGTFTDGRVIKTVNGGTTWTEVYHDALLGYLGLAVVDENTVYAGGANESIIKTTDGGSTWSSVYTGTAGYSIRAGAAVSSDVVRLCTFDILHTADGGSAWDVEHYTGLTEYLGIFFLNKDLGFACGSAGGLAKYETGATCTVDAPTDLFADVLTANKAVLSWTAPLGAVKYTVQYQTPSGIWKFTSNYNVHKVKDLSPDTKYVWSVRAYCGSPISGQSAWSAKSSFITPALKVEDSEIASSFEVFPNPVSSAATISFSLDQDSKVTADLFTIDGKKVLTIADQQFSSGANEITMNRGSLSAGIYILQIKTNDDLLTKKIELQ